MCLTLMDTKPHGDSTFSKKHDRIGQLVGAVDGLVGIGLSVTRACAQVKLSRITYYHRKRMALKYEKTPDSQQHGGTAHHSHGDSTPPRFTSSPSATSGGPDALPN
jgi:hypothetical protein